MLAALLDREPDIDVIGTTAWGSELVRLCDLRRPSVAVFEADEPRWSNERLVSLLLPPGRSMRTIGLHQALPVAHIILAYEAGVGALVQYAKGLELLLEAIRAPTLLVESARATHRKASLTARELEVLYLLCAGCAPKQIGIELGISPNTVDRHKRGIYAKLGVHNEAHAAGHALRLGLLTPATDVERVGASGDGTRLRVLLRPQDGPIARRAREVLDASRITVLEDETAPVEILIDPVDGRRDSGRHTVVLTSRERGPHHMEQAVSPRTTVLPVSRVDSLLVPAVRLAAEGYLAVKSTDLSGGGHGDGQRWRLTLTPREHEILDAIAQGLSAKQIARQLGISVRTVENLQGNLFRKLRVHRKAAAVVVAHDLGLLEG
ncbi:LuxR C-terminal-related transcriptional regulator [Saccharothrix stipae]